MKSEMKALVLVFLCLFAVSAISLVVCIASDFAYGESHAFARFTLPVDPMGDPIGTPGGGGIV